MTSIDDNLIGIWFVPLPTGAGFDNWMGTLTLKDGVPYFVHRFRHCDPVEPGADAHEGLDEKRVYNGRFTCSLDEAVASVRRAASGLAEHAGSEADELMMNPERDVQRFTDALMAKPWVQARHLTT